MKFTFTDDAKKKVWTYSSIVLLGVLFFFALYRIEDLMNFVKEFCGLLTPFILGFSIAFILNEPMKFIEDKLLKKVHINPKSKRTISAIASIILFVTCITCVLALLIPQVVTSITTLIKAFPGYIQDFQLALEEFIFENDINPKYFTQAIEDWDIISRVSEFVTAVLPKMAHVTYRIGSMLLNIIIALISALYMMIDKERLLRYFKKLNYAILPIDVANYMHRLMLSSAKIFNNFIIGKAIDSLIIGVLCYVGCVIFKFPYAILLSVIVGITNMIPVFGPFIGAIPGMLLLFIIHPITALYYALFILALQQFDGNILGPVILGDKLGLPSIGILFSVVIGGGMFNIIGMFIGVPCFAVIYMAVREWTNYRLENKHVDVQNESAKIQSRLN